MKDSEKSPGNMPRSEETLDKNIHPSNRDLFQIFTKEERDCFLEKFRSLKLSRQTQREFLQWLPEIAEREDKNIITVLGSETMSRIFHDTRINPPQKISKIREVIYKLRFPALQKAVEEWKKFSRKINPAPSSVSFFHDDYFEKEKLELKIIISDPEQARPLFRKLAEIDEKSWKMLISPLTNDTISR